MSITSLTGSDHYSLNAAMIPVVHYMRQKGVFVDPDIDNRLIEWGKKQTDIEDEVKDKFGIDPAKRNEVTKAFFSTCGVPDYVSRSSKTKQPSLDKKNLVRLSTDPTYSELASLLIQWRKITKGVEKTQEIRRFIEEDGRVHPQMSPSIPRTTRFSSSSPNLQNIAKEDLKDPYKPDLRHLFGPPPGYVWIVIDYNQLELRIFAALAEEDAMLHAFANNIDIHMLTGMTCLQIDNPTPEEITWMRKMGKVINFSVIYGVGVYKLAEFLGCSVDEAIIHKDTYLREYAGVARFARECKAYLQQNGHVCTAQGYPLRIPVDLKTGIDKDYATIDYVVQGTAGTLVKLAMYKIHKKYPKTMVLNVHDELVMEIPESDFSPDICVDFARIMEDNELPFETPVDVSWTKQNWLRKNKFEVERDRCNGKILNHSQSG